MCASTLIGFKGAHTASSIPPLCKEAWCRPRLHPNGVGYTSSHIEERLQKVPFQPFLEVLFCRNNEERDDTSGIGKGEKMVSLK